MTDAPTLTHNTLSITIRPTQEEFNRIHKEGVYLTLINYFEKSNSHYIIGLEKGKNSNTHNHYQISLLTTIHPDTIRRNINKIFKPFLKASTLKYGKWKLVKRHKDLRGLIGYCLKESDRYYTNIPDIDGKKYLQYYLDKKKSSEEKTEDPILIKTFCLSCRFKRNLFKKEDGITLDEYGILSRKQKTFHPIKDGIIYSIFCLMC